MLLQSVLGWSFEKTATECLDTFFYHNMLLSIKQRSIANYLKNSNYDISSESIDDCRVSCAVFSKDHPRTLCNSI